MQLTAKFHHPTCNRSEVIVLSNKQTDKLTNKQTPLKTPTSLRCATPKGKMLILIKLEAVNVAQTTFSHLLRLFFDLLIL